MEKGISTKRQPAIVDDDILSDGYLISMITLPKQEPIIENGTKADDLYSKAMNYLAEGNTGRGLHYLKQAYKLGDWTAGNTLAYGYSAGWFGFRNYKAFITIVKELAKKGHPGAMVNYAFAYQWGIGVKKSARWSRHWLLKAVDAGSMIAKSNLGIEYLFGKPSQRDEEEGARLCFEAAVHGQEIAMDAMGMCYEDGIVVTKNLKKAFKWYSLAVENGAGAMAEKNLARCYRKGIGIEVDMNKARKLMKAALEHGYQPKDLEKTKKLYGL